MAFKSRRKAMVKMSLEAPFLVIKWKLFHTKWHFAPKPNLIQLKVWKNSWKCGVEQQKSIITFIDNICTLTINRRQSKRKQGQILKSSTTKRNIWRKTFFFVRSIWAKFRLWSKSEIRTKAKISLWIWGSEKDLKFILR